MGGYIEVSRGDVFAEDVCVSFAFAVYPVQTLSRSLTAHTCNVQGPKGQPDCSRRSRTQDPTYHRSRGERDI